MFASPDRPARTRAALAVAIASLACTDYGVSTGVVVGEPPVANFDAAAVQSASTMLIDVCRDTDLAGATVLGGKINVALASLLASSASPADPIPPEALGRVFVLTGADGGYVRVPNSSTDAASAAFTLYQAITLNWQGSGPFLVTPLVPTGFYRLRTGAPVGFTVERAAGTAGGRADTIVSGFGTGTHQNEATISLASRPRIHIADHWTAMPWSGSTATSYDAEMTWGSAPAIGLLVTHYRVGPVGAANESRSRLGLGADTISVVNQDIYRGYHFFVNGTEANTEFVTVRNGLTLSADETVALRLVLQAMQNCSRLASELLAPMHFRPLVPSRADARRAWRGGAAEMAPGSGSSSGDDRRGHGDRQRHTNGGTNER